MHKLNQMYLEIPNILESRTNKANEFINAGVDLIGKDQPNAWLRALYFGSQKRVPYTPLHDRYPGFKCPVVDSYKNKLANEVRLKETEAALKDYNEFDL